MIVGNNIMYTTSWQEKDCKALHFLLIQKKIPYNTNRKDFKIHVQDLLIRCKL